MSRPSDSVDGEHLWSRLMALARFGARPEGGVDVVDRIDAAIRRLVETERGPCAAELRQIQHNATVTFSPLIRGAITDVAARLGIACREIASAAGHDARQLNDVCPTGMIFVPCRDGVSHNPAEWAEPADLTAGARILADLVWHLAERV